MTDIVGDGVDEDCSGGSDLIKMATVIPNRLDCDGDGSTETSCDVDVMVLYYTLVQTVTIQCCLEWIDNDGDGLSTCDGDDPEIIDIEIFGSDIDYSSDECGSESMYTSEIQSCLRFDSGAVTGYQLANEY